MKKSMGSLFVIAAGTMWGTMGIFVRYFDSLEISSINIVAIRMFVTAILLLVGTLVYDRKLLKIKLKDCWCFVGTGIISIVGFNYFYFFTMTQTSLAVAAVLLYTAPVMVMLMSVFLFKEKLTRNKLIACVMAFCGCVFVAGLVGGGSSVSLLALVTGIASGLGYALYSIFGRYALNKKYSSLTIAVYTFLFASIGILPLTDFSEVALVAMNGNSLLVAAGMGIVTTVFPYILYTVGLSKIETSKAAIMASIEPVVATIVSMTLFREKATVWCMIGIALILASTVILNLKQKEEISSEK